MSGNGLSDVIFETLDSLEGNKENDAAGLVALSISG